MRLMSFSMTTAQVRNRTKTETRRLGWARARIGQRIVAVEKAMGLEEGEHPVPLAVIEVTSFHREPVEKITNDAVAREGYPGGDAQWFIRHFCRAMRCDPRRLVSVIGFRYVEESELTKSELSQWGRLTGEPRCIQCGERCERDETLPWERCQGCKGAA